MPQLIVRQGQKLRWYRSAGDSQFSFALPVSGKQMRPLPPPNVESVSPKANLGTAIELGTSNSSPMIDTIDDDAGTTSNTLGHLLVSGLNLMPTTIRAVQTPVYLKTTAVYLCAIICNQNIYFV